MRGATECAKRLKLLHSSLRSKLGKVSRPETTDAITELILGILSRDTPETKASEGLERLRSMVVDYNELRVIPAIELTDVLSDFRDAWLKCEDISRALNAVFAQEHIISLDRLATLPKKELLVVLDEVDGLEAYTRARIRLLGFGQHAIPLDEAMWALARREQIVDQRCPLKEAQQFLERQIREDDALEFVALLRKRAWTEMGAAVEAREVERILSVPPDRTTRNMLQTVSASVAEAEEPGVAHAAQTAAPAADISGGAGDSASPAAKAKKPRRSKEKPKREAKKQAIPKADVKKARRSADGSKAKRAAKKGKKSAKPKPKPKAARSSKKVAKTKRAKKKATTKPPRPASKAKKTKTKARKPARTPKGKRRGQSASKTKTA